MIVKKQKYNVNDKNNNKKVLTLSRKFLYYEESIMKVEMKKN